VDTTVWGGPSGAWGADEIALVTFVSGFVAVMVLATIGFMVLMIIRTAKGSPIRKRERHDADETRIIQEIHHGLTRMDKRIEALETLVLDHDRSKEKQFDRDLNAE
jgi:phage shock protein B